MPRRPLYFVVASLTFIIGIVLSGLWLFHHRPITQPVQVVNPFAIEFPQPQPLSFETRMDACGPTANYHTYESSDGVFISQSNEEFSSAKRASRELQKRLRLAKEIIERSPRIDESGKRVGERVVGLSSGEGGAQTAFIVWTDGEVLSSIESPSLRHILEFEKRHN